MVQISHKHISGDVSATTQMHNWQIFSQLTEREFTRSTNNNIIFVASLDVPLQSQRARTNKHMYLHGEKVGARGGGPWRVGGWILAFSSSWQAPYPTLLIASKQIADATVG